MANGNKNITSIDFGHSHVYKVDENGNGWAYMAVHPKEPNIKHKHEILNWVVLSSKSDCYPFCESKFKYKGAPPHSHIIEGKIVGKIKQKMTKKRINLSKYKGKNNNKQTSDNRKLTTWILPRKHKKSVVKVRRK